MQRHGNTPTRFVLVQGQNTPRHHSPHTKHIQAPFTTHKTHPGTIHHAQNKYPERDDQSDTDSKVGLLNPRCRSSHAPNMGYIVYTGLTLFPKRHTPTRHAEWRQPCPQRRPPRRIITPTPGERTTELPAIPHLVAVTDTSHRTSLRAIVPPI